MITVTATKGGSTGYAQDNVNFFVLPGTQVFSVTDPIGDDNGPGTFQYPTASDFQPGAFDLTGVSVNQTASDVYLTVSIKNLASTFGNAFGAQLLDIYVHDPSATDTSTAAAFTTRNYTIAPADAWSERLELQGFASPVWVDPSGSSLGSAQMIEDQPAGTVTLVLPTSAFGTVGAGWVFTLGADRPERVQRRPGPRLHPARRRLHVRRLPGRGHGRDLLEGPEHDARGDRHDHADRRQPGDRAGPDARAGGALRGGSDESMSFDHAAPGRRPGRVAAGVSSRRRRSASQLGLSDSWRGRKVPAARPFFNLGRRGAGSLTLCTRGVQPPLDAAAFAAAQVAQVRDDPAGRLALLRASYDGPFGPSSHHRPFRRAALSFMGWELRRGVLAPASATRPGSAWWRALNERLLRDGCEAVARAGGRGGEPSS